MQATLTLPANSAAAPALARRLALGMKMDPMRWAMFLLTVFTVSRIHQHFPGIARLKPMLLMVGISFMYALANPKELSTGKLLDTWPMKFVAGLALAACLSTAFGISIGSSGRFILDTYSRTLVYGFLLALAIRNATDLYQMVWGYVIATGILSYLSLFVFGLSKSAGSEVSRLSNLYTYDANDVGLVVLVGLPLALLLFQVAKPQGKLVAFVCLAGIGGTIARSGSRGAFIGLVAVGLVLLLTARTVSIVKRLFFLIAVTGALAAFAPPGYWKQMQTLLQPNSDYNYTSQEGRKAVFKRGLYYIGEYPVFGLGINNFAKAECEISPKLKNHRVGTGLRCTAPHNSFIEAGAETGLFGLVFWFGLLGGCVFGLGRLHRKLPAHWVTGSAAERLCYLAPSYLSAATVGFCVSGFFVSFAWMDIIYIIAALATGIYVSIDQLEQIGARGATPRVTAAPSVLDRDQAGWRTRRSAVRVAHQRALGVTTTGGI